MYCKKIYHSANQWGRLKTTGFSLLLALSIFSVAGYSQSSPVEIVDPPIAAENEPDQSLSNAIKTFPIGINRRVRKITVGGESDTHTTAGVTEKLVYSNTLGKLKVQILPNFLVADDISLMAPDGCTLSRYTFQVTGRVDPEGVDGFYRIDFGLYESCPNAGGKALRVCNDGPLQNQSCISNSDCGGVCLDGINQDQPCLTNDECPESSCRTDEDIFSCDPLIERVFIPADQADDIITIEYIPPQDSNILLYSNMWLGVKFNRQNAGLVMGAPALVGFSEDIVDFPGFACNANLGGFPELGHGSFNAEFYVTDTCPDAFPGYRNVRDSGAPFNLGASIWLGDDIELGVDSCEMVSYEIGVRDVGFYTFEMRFDDNGLPGDIIPDTRRFLINNNSGVFKQGRFSFDSPISIPAKVWMTVRVGNTIGGWVLTGKQATIGQTRNSLYVQDPDTLLWQRRNAPAPSFAGFHTNITCAGQPPVGACCDPIFLDENNDAVCRDIPQMNCAYPPRDSGLFPEWAQGKACDPNPFPLPCGVAACCTPADFCENLTFNECAALSDPGDPILWQRGFYCNEGEQECPNFSCLTSAEDCAVSHDATGCDSHNCCNRICNEDRWCCQVTWDTICVREAQSICGRSPQRGSCQHPIQISANTSNVFATGSNQPDLSYSCHSIEPGGRGFSATWLSFEADETSAIISTCDTRIPIDDTLLAVYRAEDLTNPHTICDSLVEIGCNDDEKSCGSGLNAQLCVDNLEIGQTYYIQVATKEPVRGVYQLDLESPCPALSATAEHHDIFSKIAYIRNSVRDPDPDLTNSDLSEAKTETNQITFEHKEVLDDPYLPRQYSPLSTATTQPNTVVRDGFVSVQVNVDANGLNIPGDAANEPSIAIDPTNPNKIVIGWRQFDTIASNFRQAGWAYSHNGGLIWTFPGVLEPGIFRSDPVLAADADGNIYYYSLKSNFTCDLFKSTDGGVTWDKGVFAMGGDKAWMTIDRTNNIGKNNIYTYWTSSFSCCREGNFTRSTDRGLTFMTPIRAQGQWGTLTVDHNGFLYIYGSGQVIKSTNAMNALEAPLLETPVRVDLGGNLRAFSSGPNPGGLLGQYWIDSDHSNTPASGNLYALASIVPAGTDPLDVMFARSTDGGDTWSAPVRVNDDPVDNGAWQWFGTMSVAPNGRIDVFWNDTRNTGQANLSELYYSFSWDGGLTWSKNVPVSPVWDSWVGWPSQNKIGDYYHSISDNQGANLAYAATFNGEQDVYYLRIGDRDCNGNGVPDDEDVANGTSEDCDGNSFPDECGRDCDGNGALDTCEIMSGTVTDCNHNNVPDRCESDIDFDGIIDVCDPDIDGDGVPNEIDLCKFSPFLSPVMEDGRPVGDTNANCELDLVDYWRFRNCINRRRSGPLRHHLACHKMFDLNNDFRFNLRDFATFQNNFGQPVPDIFRPDIDRY